jgi:hypothetical protein
MYYYLAKLPNKNGDYEIHQKNCFKHHMLPYRIYLGEFNSCEEVMQEAVKYHENAVFCPICLRHCIKRESPPYEPHKELFEDFLLSSIIKNNKKK